MNGIVSADSNINAANESKEVKNPPISMALKQRTKISLRTLGTLKRRRRKKRKNTDEEQLPKLGPSNVYLEDPSDLTLRNEPMEMDVMDFWYFVHESRWRGRLRICEGELMQKLIECFDDLAQNKIIGKVTTTRKYRMRNDDRTSSRFSEEEKHEERSEKHKHHVVRASFSYYGGIPLKKHRKVTFASVPNSVYVPPIRHILPIIKYTDNTGISSKEEALSRLNTLYSPLFPRLHWDNDDESQANHDADEWFISPLPEDLANRCMKAAHDFIIVKEQFTDSETWRTVTSLTFSRKERKWRVSRIVEAMPSYYTAVDFPMYGYALERRPVITKAEGLLAIDTIHVTKKYTIARSRNPQNKRTLTRKETMKRGASKR